MGHTTTQLAGQALADAVHTANRHGIDHPETLAAAQVADAMTTAALHQGATAEEIRRAGGLPT